MIKEFNESYQKDRSIMTADQLEEERKLWSFFENEELIIIPIEGKKVILYQDNPELQLNNI